MTNQPLEEVMILEKDLHWELLKEITIKVSPNEELRTIYEILLNGEVQLGWKVTDIVIKEGMVPTITIKGELWNHY